MEQIAFETVPFDDDLRTATFALFRGLLLIQPSSNIPNSNFRLHDRSGSL